MPTTSRLDLDLIASTAGISRQAVWRWLFGDWQGQPASEFGRIQAALADPAYAPLLPPRRVGSSGTTAVVVPSGSHSARQDFAGNVLRAFIDEAKQYGFALSLRHQWTEVVPDLRTLFNDVHDVVMARLAIYQAAQVATPLTTLRQRMAEIGRLDLSQGQAITQGQRPDGRAILLPADLIVRASTGPAPNR